MHCESRSDEANRKTLFIFHRPLIVDRSDVLRTPREDMKYIITQSFGGLTNRIHPATSVPVNRFAAYYFSFDFWAYFAPKHLGGCHEN